MKQRSDGIAQIAGGGCVLVGIALVLFIVGCQLPASTRAEIEKGTPETPSSVAVVAGTFLCHDGNAYRVVLTLNSNGTYWARGSSCLKNKGDASGSGTWKLTERRIVLAPSKEEGWMNKEPKVFDVLKFKGDWIFVRADWPDYYNEHGVTDVSCFQRQVPEESYTPIPDAELPLLKPFKATVEQMQPCAAYLKTTDGRRIRIGSPGATPEVAGFVAGLQEGRRYNLPEAFLEYRKGQAAEP
jgi:hypothetical protein